MKTMKTWQDFANNTNAAVTTWLYDEQRGWLADKRYQDNKEPDYTYSAAGRLQTRTWARGITTTYAYNNAGDLASVSYNDNNTPATTTTFDRLGRRQTITRDGITARIYSDAGPLLSETFNGVTVTNQFDSLLRRTNYALLNAQLSPLTALNYGFDAASRLQTVSDGTNSTTYSFLSWCAQQATALCAQQENNAVALLSGGSSRLPGWGLQRRRGLCGDAA